MPHNKDIDFLIDELGQIKNNLDDDKRLRSFVSTYADDIIELLSELKEKRDATSAGHASLIKQNIHRTLVEGYSDDNIHEAFSKALGKVKAYFSEEHDVSVTVVGLVDLPKGGHRATLEVQLTPIKLSLTTNAKQTDHDRKRKAHHKEDLLHEQQESYYLQHLILEHFMHGSEHATSIPDHLLIHIHERDILRTMVEKGFFKAAHAHNPSPEHSPHPTPKSKVTVMALKYDRDET